jgi:lantibiotic transport system ATP-binding protein
MQNDFIIQTRQLTCRFGSVVAVDHLDLSVPAGTVYGFLGPNGAGKTTTIRLLLGLLKPAAGEIRLFGRPFSPRDWPMLDKIGALVESPSLYPHLTGRENLELTRRLVGASPRQVERALATVRMEKDAGRLVGQYSMGMRQRLGFALALLNQPALLVLDEPTNGLDPAGIHEMRELIRNLPQAEGVTVFISSHLLSEVEQMASHLGIIQQGRLLFEGSLAQLQAQYAQQLWVRVDRPEDALGLLRRQGWQAHKNGKPEISVEVNGDADVALVNNSLVYNGFNVFHLDLARPALEDVFLALTKPEQPALQSEPAKILEVTE